MSETTDVEEQQHSSRDLLTVLVLSITAVLTAWCGFESSKWGGEMSIAFSQASSARARANDYASQARDARQLDVSIYGQWVSATAAEQERLAGYIEERFPASFRTAFDAWNADGRQEATPFEREEYRPPGTAETQEWNEVADQHFQDALINNQRGDDYSLLTVLFALVLFFSAPSQRFKKDRMARLLLTLAIVIGVGGFILMLTFPVKI